MSPVRSRSPAPYPLRAGPLIVSCQILRTTASNASTSLHYQPFSRFRSFPTTGGYRRSASIFDLVIGITNSRDACHLLKLGVERRCLWSTGRCARRDAFRTPNELQRVRQEVPMGTIEIHEPEVKEVKPVSRPGAPVLPKKGIAAEPFTPRTMFSDSLLDFGP